MNRRFVSVILGILTLAVASPSARASGTKSDVGKSDVGKSTASSGTAKMVLLLGVMKTDPEHERLAEGLSSVSRQALGELPGVQVLDADASPSGAPAAASKRRVPVVMITGKLCDVEQRKDGDEVVVSAKVEYFVHRMPGQSIAAVVSGTAKAKVAQIQVRKRSLREKLEFDLMSAAVESAVKRTAPALKAALQ